VQEVLIYAGLFVLKAILLLTPTAGNLDTDGDDARYRRANGSLADITIGLSGVYRAKSLA
jgi:hypothetical protein